MKFPLWILSIGVLVWVVFSIDRTMKADRAAAVQHSRKALAERYKPAFYVIQDGKMYLNGIGADQRKDRIGVDLNGQNPSLLLGTDNYWTVTGVANRPGWRVLNPNR
jgi:hypothetical protein